MMMGVKVVVVGTMRSAYMGLGLYGFSGYKGNFWVDRNEMGIHTIEYFGFKVNF